MRVFVFALAASIAFAQETPKEHPPTPREYAAHLLESVRESAASADPQLAPFLAWRAADAYIAVDKKKAASMLEDAFNLAVAIPPEAPFGLRARVQVSVAESMAEIDLSKSAELLPRIHVNDEELSYDPRSAAAVRIVAAYLKDKKIDDALEFANSLGATGPYSYAGVRQIIEAIPPDDGRRVILFGAAITAYQSHPNEDFVKLVAAHWKDLPRRQVEAALDGIVAHVQSYSDDQNNLHVSYTTAKGIANLPNRRDSELFEIIAPLRAFEPDKLDRILAQDTDLSRALDVMPDGFDGSHIQGASMGSPGKNGPAKSQSAFLISSSIAAKAMQAIGDSPEQAFDLAKSISDSAWRASCYMQMAPRFASSGDAAHARQAVSLAVSSLEQVDTELDLAGQVWSRVIDFASGTLKDEDLAREAFSKSLDTLDAMYRADSNPEEPNTAPIDYWPSTAAYRRTFQMAAKLYGIAGAGYFEKIHDPNELLESQIAFAVELLGRPPQPAITASNHAKKQ